MLLTGCYVILLITRCCSFIIVFYSAVLQNTMSRHWSPGDLSRVLRIRDSVFFSAGVFCLALFPAFQGFPWASNSTSSKLAWLYAVVWNSSDPSFCLNHTTIHKLSNQKNLYLNRSNIARNYLWWKV